MLPGIVVEPHGNRFEATVEVFGAERRDDGVWRESPLKRVSSIAYDSWSGRDSEDAGMVLPDDPDMTRQVSWHWPDQCPWGR